MPTLDLDISYMRRALKLARRGEGWTSPNPMVGAVVVRGETVVGEGWHEKAGGPHAEVNAIRRAGEAARGATLYVTLEPCNHTGRTPPCTWAVLEAGIQRVVAGMKDPNPRVQGGGAAFLEAHGLRVDLGVMERECRLLNQPFIKHVTQGLPYVTLKTASTLDGRIASRTGDARWVTNERSRRFVHVLRHRLDAVLVGVGTALADDPLLTARLGRRPCRQPIRIVLDSKLRLPLSSRLAGTARQVPLWIACAETASPEKEARLRDLGAEVIRLNRSDRGLDLHQLLEGMGRRAVTSVLVEGGARVTGSFLDAEVADEAFWFFAPKILGDPGGVPAVSGTPRERMLDAVRLHNVKTHRFGQDVMVHGRFREELY
ncbi:bifunctional diaminohydroxyphosphoribosylaminopyrimidine deaminase/5-amino-6-(5-phosphoribosylamino)uracil reductase RibD [Desulfoglaeba alkanexedens]|nr:bifunctional diaminohydroxyphosphoribosylaminopyrimidine deaminase/5-amino-6-(5-phosphoribosylamino)uracil reductase RibD [Desulfoglaeba alkanexedens]